MSQSSVQKSIIRNREQGDYQARHRTDRPRVTSRRTDAAMRRIVVATHTASASFIASQLPEGDTPSVWTIRRRLRNDFCMKAHRPARKPLLSAKIVKDRLRFCRTHRLWDASDWEKVVFSDESLIRLFHRYAPYVCRPPGERFNLRFTLPAVKTSPSTMIWGAITARGALDLWLVLPKTAVNAYVYLCILEERLCQGMATRNCSIFQHDGAPCHTARSQHQPPG